MTGSVVEPGPATVRRGVGFWLSRTVDALLVAAAVLPFVDVRMYRDPFVLVVYGAVWLGLGAVYIIVRLVRLRPSRRDAPGWERLLAGRRTGRLVTVATAAEVLGAGSVLAGRPLVGLAYGPEFERAVVGLSVATVVVAWSVLHLSYAERYARIWRQEAERTGSEPITFPGTSTPRLRDFAYFSFTIGLAFATSDAEIRSSLVRATVLWHAVLSFVYNTAIAGLVVALIVR
ncbi:DUF1345 domain-containing protein [Pseudonocardia endophytica]|uniref:Uncharacterized protein DUF1345 n=1 Tax=Pseudonocardia endophytica TaxID=401976 RepID=A0A4R1HV42_PSEEN|nr:DUF1345 domain-containing protein [Pseudonocardia endophytica]TCK25253.1 uncharacterized protein DUF1345 [Pseudonocardia endophytica]